jgi:hypothetical protein
MVHKGCALLTWALHESKAGSHPRGSNLQLSVNCNYANTKSCLYVTVANIASRHFKPMTVIIRNTNLSTDPLHCCSVTDTSFQVCLECLE